MSACDSTMSNGTGNAGLTERYGEDRWNNMRQIMNDSFLELDAHQGQEKGDKINDTFAGEGVP